VKLTVKSPRFLVLALVVLLAPLAAGCEDNTPAGPSSGAPYSQTDLTVGTGTEAVAGKQVTVSYSGWLYDPSKPDNKGLLFDTSMGRGSFTFTLGLGQVIEGWDRGVAGMKVGGRRRLVIPPSLGYGSTRYSAIPANSTLVFDVELQDVQDAS
jgi:FKBP-type peptidyl-prolyl cis-trans isomerase FkpA